MSSNVPIRALFLDIGGVLLTNGWDRNSRAAAAKKFGIDAGEMNERHKVIFDAYESGKMTLDEYLQLLIFFEKRDFSADDFKQFMMSQSTAYPEMIKLIIDLKKKYSLACVAVNNEGRELNEYRIKQFGLKNIFDIFASSSFINARKPDKMMYKIALDLAQVKPEETIYIDDRQVFIEVASPLGINTIRHVNIETTVQQFQQLGLYL